MNKIILFSLLALSNIGFARIDNKIVLMSPQDRYNLSVSMKELGDAYVSRGYKTKAKDFYRAALDVYPIGDKAHQLANQLNVPLNDNQTYSNFVMMGDEAYKKGQYSHALGNYQMAHKLHTNVELYTKLADTYQKLGKDENALFYRNLSEGQIETNHEDHTDMEEKTEQEDYLLVEEMK